MVVSNTGKNKIRDLIAANINSGKVGTDGTDATVSDTGLGAETAGIDKTPTISTSNKTINFQYTVLSTEQTGTTFKEGGIFFTDDVMLDRFVYPDFSHTADDELVVVDIIKVI